MPDTLAISKPESAAPIAELLAILRARQHFLVTSHARPDGDAIGSALGMMHLLEAMGKSVQVAFADPIPLIYRALPGADRITSALPQATIEAAVILECSSVERTGYAAIDAAFTINIDHHLSGREYADFNWIDPEECAVGAMVYQVAVASGMPISPEMATCLYVAVLTDTGSFNYPSTTAATFALASHLVASGADPSAIAQQIYSANPASKLRLLGTALQHMKIEGTLAWTWITLADVLAVGAGDEDSEGIVNQLVGIAGVQAAVFFRELPATAAGVQEFRLNLRSKGDVDVAKVAETFGGGGHRNASGCTIVGSLESTQAAVLARLRQQAGVAAA